MRRVFGRPKRPQGFEEKVKGKQRQRKVRIGFTTDVNSIFSVEDLRLAQSLFASMAAKRLRYESENLEAAGTLSDSKRRDSSMEDMKT